MFVKIKLFAALKDYFDSSMQIELKSQATIQDLLDTLININPKAKDVLTTTRFAFNNQIVDLNCPLNDQAEIFIYPPSSGG